MAFSLFFSLTVIIFVSFVATKNKLHLFEILFMWMVIIFIHHTFLTIFILNMNLIEISGHGSNYWTLVFNRITLFPLIIIWLIDIILSTSIPMKVLFVSLTLCTLVGLDYLQEAMKIFEHSQWKVWWSFIEWGIIICLVYVSWIWYRKILLRELR